MTREEIEKAAKAFAEKPVPYLGQTIRDDMIDFAIQQVNAALEEAANRVSGERHSGSGVTLAEMAIRALKIP